MEEGQVVSVYGCLLYVYPPVVGPALVTRMERVIGEECGPYCPCELVAAIVYQLLSIEYDVYVALLR